MAQAGELQLRSDLLLIGRIRIELTAKLFDVSALFVNFRMWLTFAWMAIAFLLRLAGRAERTRMKDYARLTRVASISSSSESQCVASSDLHGTHDVVSGSGAGGHQFRNTFRKHLAARAVSAAMGSRKIKWLVVKDVRHCGQVVRLRLK